MEKIKVSSAQYFTLHYKYDECAYDCANQPLVMFRSQNMKFSAIFSHFSQILAKNGCFWS